MNERIKRLATEARLLTGWSVGEVEYQKFAELIVKECADLDTHDDVTAPVGQSAYGEAYQDGWTEGTKAYRETILEHFGVES